MNKTSKRGINYRNVMYMLCYAVDELKNLSHGENRFENVGSLDGLFAEMFIMAYNEIGDNVLKQYKQETEFTDRPHGKIDIVKSMTSGQYAQGNIACSYHKLDTDNIVNQTIKLAIWTLMESQKLHKAIHKDKMNILYKMYDDMGHIRDIGITEYDMDKLDYIELTNEYKPVVAASIMIIENMLTINMKSNVIMYELEESSRLKFIFEKFVRRFLDIEYKHGIAKVYHPKYSFYNPDGNISRTDQLDMLVIEGSSALVIDTKWYENSETSKANEYQVYTYAGSVVGRTPKVKEINALILYAESVKIRKPVKSRRMLGELETWVCSDTVNMDDNFENIKKRLIELTDKYMNLRS